MLRDVAREELEARFDVRLQLDRYSKDPKGALDELVTLRRQHAEIVGFEGLGGDSPMCG